MAECIMNHETERVVSKETGIDYIVCHTCRKTLGRVCEVYSRVVGYLRPVSGWNKGKKAEFVNRKTYEMPKTFEVLKGTSEPCKLV